DGPAAARRRRVGGGDGGADGSARVGGGERRIGRADQDQRARAFDPTPPWRLDRRPGRRHLAGARPAGRVSREPLVQAQEGAYDHAIADLRRGRKRGHWMWFVFPQVVGLGFSAMAQTYAIASLAEARAYLAHPVLGPRLLECSQAVLDARV